MENCRRQIRRNLKREWENILTRVQHGSRRSQLLWCQRPERPRLREELVPLIGFVTTITLAPSVFISNKLQKQSLGREHFLEIAKDTTADYVAYLVGDLILFKLDPHAHFEVESTMAGNPNTSTVSNWDDHGAGPMTVSAHVSAVVVVMEQVSVAVGEPVTNTSGVTGMTNANTPPGVVVAMTYTSFWHSSKIY